MRTMFVPARLVAAAGWLGLILAILIITVASPLGLVLIEPGSDNWPQLSVIGQAYGGISAVISSLALAGVGVSLIVQARQHRLEQVATIRSMQFSVYDVVRQDPKTFASVIGFPPDTASDRVLLTTLYVQFFQYLAASFEVGLVAEEGLRLEVFPAVFRHQSGRDYWSSARASWLVSQAKNPKRRRFIAVADDELRRSLDRPGLPPASGEAVVGPQRSHAQALMVGGLLGLNLSRV